MPLDESTELLSAILQRAARRGDGVEWLNDTDYDIENDGDVEEILVTYNLLRKIYLYLKTNGA